MTEADIAERTSVGAVVPDGRLRELAHRALRQAALAALSGEGEGEREGMDVGMRELMQRACHVARERGLRAEQLLVILKEVWRELPEGRRMSRPDGDEVLSRAITVCIREYFAPVRASH